MESDIKELIQNLVKRLADEPENIKIEERQQDDATVFEAHGVAKSDMGKVIGRKGQNIKSIRTIVGACGAKQKKRYMFQVIDEE